MQTLIVLVLLAAPRTPAPAAPPAAPQISPLALDAFPSAARAALTPLVERARRAPDDARAAGTLAMALQAWEQWEAAHDAYARTRTLDPRAFEWAYLDGVVLLRLGRADEAVAALRAASALAESHGARASAATDRTAPSGAESPSASSISVAGSDGYLPLRVKLAEALFESGQEAESARLYADLVRVPAAEPIAAFGLGRIAADAGRHEEALTRLRTAVERFPEYGAAHYTLARVYRALGREEEAARARAAHQRYGARWPALEDPVLARVSAMRSDPRAALLRGQKLAAAGDVAGAIAAYEEALGDETGSTRAQAHVGLISLYGRQRNWTSAEEHYRAAVATGEELEDAYYNHGVLLGLQERWEEAAAAYRLALGVNPRHPQALNNLGQTFERRHAFGEAEAAYRRAVEANPSFRLARFNLARMLIFTNRAREALHELQRTLEPRDAETPRYLFGMATAYVHLGDRAEGLKWAAQARDLAIVYDQRELAEAIDRNLATLR